MLGFSTGAKALTETRCASLPFDAPMSLVFLSHGRRVGLFSAWHRYPAAPIGSGSTRAAAAEDDWVRLRVDRGDMPRLVALLREVAAWDLRRLMPDPDFRSTRDERTVRQAVASAIAQGIVGLYSAPLVPAIASEVGLQVSAAQAFAAREPLAAFDRRPTWQSSPLRPGAYVTPPSDDGLADVNRAVTPPVATAAAVTTAPTSDASAASTVRYWIEIALVGEDDKPIPNLPYLITAEDGTTYRGALDADGWARIEGLESDSACRVSFPSLDQDAWEPLSVLPARVDKASQNAT